MIDVKTLKKSARGKKVLIDSNIIIYLTEEIEPYHRLSRELFSMIEEGASNAVISILSVSEVMQGPLRSGKTDIATAVRNYLLNFPSSHCQDITSGVLDCVGQDERVNWKTLRTMDALIIASGLYARVDLFVSNDRHFINSIPPEMMLSFENRQ
ncbi:MAG: type II toxin-antitoxin system VapC family toxin [Desulfobacterales bacterium]|nr:type II toxin-antitoxin system VapC family toxin [Desulfobacterales bacterium]